MKRTRRKKTPPDGEEHPVLFELASGRRPERRGRGVQNPIWTENKARLIERYLYYFVLITKHGTYIDGFAGPQAPDKLEMWAAKLVLDSEPRWLRNFYLFESDEEQLNRLHELKNSQLPEPRRQIEIIEGDFNKNVLILLASNVVKPTEATFCLLDQRTFECHWASLEALARYKPPGYHKIELFYFFPSAWLDRALTAQKDLSVPTAWWGRPDWRQLKEMKSLERAMFMAKRFRDELGYWSCRPWAVYERKTGGPIMYFMIHATDHPAAPLLMERAYRQAVQPKEPPEQTLLDLGLDPQS